MSTKTLLCVDDEPSILNALKRLLRREGYTLYTASSGQQGLELLESTPVDMVMSDYRMPEMTGTEFLKQVKANYPNTIRVILSGYADSQAIEDALESGDIYRFLAKPWKDDTLKTEINDCFEPTVIPKEQSDCGNLLRTCVNVKEIATSGFQPSSQ